MEKDKKNKTFMKIGKYILVSILLVVFVIALLFFGSRALFFYKEYKRLAPAQPENTYIIQFKDESNPDLSKYKSKSKEFVFLEDINVVVAEMLPRKVDKLVDDKDIQKITNVCEGHHWSFTFEREEQKKMWEVYSKYSDPAIYRAGFETGLSDDVSELFDNKKVSVISKYTNSFLVISESGDEKYLEYWGENEKLYDKYNEMSKVNAWEDTKLTKEVIAGVECHDPAKDGDYGVFN